MALHPQLARAQSEAIKGWTETRVIVAKALYNDGASAAEVARLIGGVTRNAVIGKIHRDELSDPKRKLPSRSNEQAKGVRQPGQRRVHERGHLIRVKAPARERPIPPNVVDARIPERQRLTLDQLGNCVCHWPVGDPREPGFFFCGAPKANGDSVSYCPSHEFRSRLAGSSAPRKTSVGPNASWRSR